MCATRRIKVFPFSSCSVSALLALDDDERVRVASSSSSPSSTKDCLFICAARVRISMFGRGGFRIKATSPKAKKKKTFYESLKLFLENVFVLAVVRCSWEKIWYTFFGVRFRWEWRRSYGLCFTTDGNIMIGSVGWLWNFASWSGRKDYKMRIIVLGSEILWPDYKSMFYDPYKLSREFYLNLGGTHDSWNESLGKNRFACITSSLSMKFSWCLIDRTSPQWVRDQLCGGPILGTVSYVQLQTVYKRSIN